jgi:hypothetical protein
MRLGMNDSGGPLAEKRVFAWMVQPSHTFLYNVVLV